MKVLVDMQGAQTPFSKHRGVGRYTRELAKAMAEVRNEKDQLVLALNGSFPESISEIRGNMEHIIGQENICVWQQFFDTVAVNPQNEARVQAGKILREEFLASQQPDVIFSTNLQEGILDPASTSVKECISDEIYCSTLHDVTPLMFPEKYLTEKMNTAWYMSKIEDAKKSDLILTVSEFSKQQIHKLLQVPLEKIFVTYNAIDRDFFCPKEISLDEQKVLSSKYGITDKFLLYTGGCDEHKNLNRLYKAFSLLPEEIRNTYQLVMVGKELGREASAHKRHLLSLGIENRVIFAGFVPDDDLISLYNMCALFVFPSISEGFGIPPLEAISCGALTLSSNTTSLPEVVAVKEALFNPYDEQEIADKICIVLNDKKLAEDIRQQEMAYAERFSWKNTAKELWQVLHTKFGENSLTKREAADKISSTADRIVKNINNMPLRKKLTQEDLKSIALSITESVPINEHRKHKILLDASATVFSDDKSGIQRVARAIANEFLTMDLGNDLEADVVYTTPEKKEFYRATKLYNHIKGIPLAADEEDEWIDIQAGDIILFMDLHPALAFAHKQHLQYLMNKGVRVYYIVHDILPLFFPQYFNEDFQKEFEEWIARVVQSNGAICASQAVAKTVSDYIDKTGKYRPNFHLGWVHWGANVENSLPSKGIPEDADTVFTAMKERHSFLMVGTVEPRKGHLQMLDVFEELWQQEDFDWNLIIVGRLGWKMDEFAAKMQQHPLFKKKLFWLNGISDEYLTKIYNTADCLLAASEGEGFGLPLIEAAQYNIPILARDIEVFHEVAGDNAIFFDGSSNEAAMNGIKNWINLYHNGTCPDSKNIPYLSWRESAEMLYDVMIKNKWWKIK